MPFAQVTKLVAPAAVSAICSAASRYFCAASDGTGEVVAAVAKAERLGSEGKPLVAAGMIATTAGTFANRSLIVLRYSALLRRRSGERPGSAPCTTASTSSGDLPLSTPGPTIMPVPPVPVVPACANRAVAGDDRDREPDQCGGEAELASGVRHAGLLGAERGLTALPVRSKPEKILVLHRRDRKSQDTDDPHARAHAPTAPTHATQATAAVAQLPQP